LNKAIFSNWGRPRSRGIRRHAMQAPGALRPAFWRSDIEASKNTSVISQVNGLVKKIDPAISRHRPAT
jgi:hypothetical protein